LEVALRTGRGRVGILRPTIRAKHSSHLPRRGPRTRARKRHHPTAPVACLALTLARARMKPRSQARPRGTARRITARPTRPQGPFMRPHVAVGPRPHRAARELGDTCST
jgi:hypothetical protein